MIVLFICQVQASSAARFYDAIDSRAEELKKDVRLLATYPYLFKNQGRLPKRFAATLGLMIERLPEELIPLVECLAEEKEGSYIDLVQFLIPSIHAAFIQVVCLDALSFTTPRPEIVKAFDLIKEFFVFFNDIFVSLACSQEAKAAIPRMQELVKAELVYFAQALGVVYDSSLEFPMREAVDSPRSPESVVSVSIEGEPLSEGGDEVAPRQRKGVTFADAEGCRLVYEREFRSSDRVAPVTLWTLIGDFKDLSLAYLESWGIVKN